MSRRRSKLLAREKCARPQCAHLVRAAVDVIFAEDEDYVGRGLIWIAAGCDDATFETEITEFVEDFFERLRDRTVSVVDNK